MVKPGLCAELRAVIPGRGLGIHAMRNVRKDVDGRAAPGHDGLGDGIKRCAICGMHTSHSISAHARQRPKNVQ